MNIFASWVWIVASAAHDGANAVTVCRAAHATDPAAHIACLEDALRPRDVPPLTTPPRAEPQPGAAKGLGSEQLSERRTAASSESISVQIAAVAYGAAGHGVFHLTDGQVWRETEAGPRNRRLATDKTYSATIERGKVRGYRMYVDGVRRMIKVERLK
jgi:hypothetical protein